MVSFKALACTLVLGLMHCVHGMQAASASDILLDQVGGGLTKDNLNTIMSLVSIAENSNTDWTKNYNYCEDIGDGRGYTVSLVGFCSGTSDLLEVIKDVKALNPNHALVQFIPALQKVDGTESHSGLEKLCSTIASNGDATWKKAVWQGIKKFYLDSSLAWAAKHKLTSVFAKGFLFDVALNHGESGLDQIAKYVSGAKAPSDGGDETAYMKAYIKARIHVVTVVDKSTNNGQTDRMDMWQSILDKNNLSLTGTMKVTCYGESFTVEGGAGSATTTAPTATTAATTATPKPTTTKTSTTKPTTTKPSSTKPATTAAPSSTPKPTESKTSTPVATTAASSTTVPVATPAKTPAKTPASTTKAPTNGSDDEDADAEDGEDSEGSDSDNSSEGDESKGNDPHKGGNACDRKKHSRHQNLRRNL